MGFTHELFEGLHEALKRGTLALEGAIEDMVLGKTGSAKEKALEVSRTLGDCAFILRDVSPDR